MFNLVSMDYVFRNILRSKFGSVIFNAFLIAVSFINALGYIC